jgi:peptidoglycan/LPS O-acetylase OafA/YrhL
MLASTLVLEQGLAHKWLGARPLARIGAISYSIYIWQQIILIRPQHPVPLGIIAKFPFNLICVFFVAACSHYLLEKPMIAVGRQLAARRKTRAAPGATRVVVSR